MARVRGMRGATRVYFASDIHGSEVAWRKFVNAAAFYDAHVLVFGGDLMGKQLVPVVGGAGGYQARVYGEDHAFEEDGLGPFTEWLGRIGAYWKVMDREEYEHARDLPDVQAELFRDLAAERLAAWLDRAEDRLAGTGIRMFLTGGNDDEPTVLGVLEAHRGDRVVACEGRVVDLDGEHTMVTVGWSSPTPWNTWREANENDMAAMIEEAVADVPDVGRCVFNFHCPPKDTPIDTCAELTLPDPATGEDALPTVVRIGGRVKTTGGGSSAVREALERYQPVAGLHGHIHESGGRFRIGRTQCFNPGSEYAQGTLRGWMVGLRGGDLTANQAMSG
ncbi:MAG TPA: metallophosphoesterase [Actinomycetota bacterium]|nr:metallophosphoesterase [Actinomycetota bacterium]